MCGQCWVRRGVDAHCDAFPALLWANSPAYSFHCAVHIDGKKAFHAPMTSLCVDTKYRAPHASIMKYIFALIVIIITRSQLCSYGGEVQIIDIQESPGQITWNNSDTTGVYSIQWAASADGPWVSNWASQVNIRATGVTHSSAIPMFYRISWISNDTTAAISENFDGSDWTTKPLASWTHIAFSGRWQSSGVYIGEDASRAYSAERYAGFYDMNLLTLPEFTKSPTQIVFYARQAGADGSYPLCEDKKVYLTQKSGSIWMTVAHTVVVNTNYQRIVWNVSFGEPMALPTLSIMGCNLYVDNIEVRTKP